MTSLDRSEIDERSNTAPNQMGSEKFRALLKRWPLGIAFLGALLVGVVVGRQLPPFWGSDTFARQFLLSSGFAGSVAFLGAGGAALVAYLNSLRDREQRQASDYQTQWWTRFVWACEKAVDRNPREAQIGLHALTHLIESPLMTDEDVEFAYNITMEISGQHEAAESDGEESTQIEMIQGEQPEVTRKKVWTNSHRGDVQSGTKE